MPSPAPAERVRATPASRVATRASSAVEARAACNAPGGLRQGLPLAIDIPGFIHAILEDNDREAVAIIRRSSLLPAVCGRVCPQESQCMAECTLGKMKRDPLQSVAIGRLERFVSDREREEFGVEAPSVRPETGRKVAVVGSGPAGITVAADVRREGHAVTLFEAFHKPGGVLMYGIPEFRLPKRIVEAEIENLRHMGVEIRTDFVIGRSRQLRDLLDRDGFEAVFIVPAPGCQSS